jgi:hypothetical protein
MIMESDTIQIAMHFESGYAFSLFDIWLNRDYKKYRKLMDLIHLRKRPGTFCPDGCKSEKRLLQKMWSLGISMIFRSPRMMRRI